MWVADQKDACRMSDRVIETFLAGVLHLPLSTGPFRDDKF
jgi:hypothetical protein